MTVMIVRCVLAVCFGMAAIGKLHAGSDRFSEMLNRYRLPFGQASKRAAQSIIGFEFAAAILLLTPLYPVGAALAALLAAGFGFAVSGVLARGDRFPCECFGTALPITASAWLFGMDLLLLASGVFLIQHSQRGDSISPALDLIVLAGCILIVGFGGQAARIAIRRRAMMGLSPGTAAPEFTARTLAGTFVDSRELYARESVLVFVKPGCSICEALLSRLPRIWNGDAGLLIAGTSDVAGMERLLQSSEVPASAVLNGADAPRIRDLFRMRVSPGALVLEKGRVSHKLIPATVEEISSIVGSMNRRR